MKLGALVSSGKDSIYATYVMKRKGYKISCLITINSKNPDSYMYHTPNIDLVKLQSKAINIPLIEQETEGKKEAELKDLEKALTKAKSKYRIQGIVTGALFSNYQRKRIENVCNKLSLEVFSPLWHMDQETEMRKILEDGFRFIITKIASEGLDRSWLGKEVTEKDVDKLVGLNKRYGINIAFEGGEAESLMVKGPIFKKKLIIEDAEIIMENECTGLYKIKKARME